MGMVVSMKKGMVFKLCLIFPVLMVPTIIIAILESGLVGNYDLSSLKQIIYGASPMPVAWIKKTFETFTGVQIAQGYGLTETSPLITILDHQSHVAALNSESQIHLSSCGRSPVGVDIRIVNEQDQVLPSGEEGEITVRGENVFKGYYMESVLGKSSPDLTGSTTTIFKHLGSHYRLFLDEGGIIKSEWISVGTDSDWLRREHPGWC